MIVNILAIEEPRLTGQSYILESNLLLQFKLLMILYRNSSVNKLHFLLRINKPNC